MTETHEATPTPARRRRDTLTPKEKDVLRQLMLGHSNKTIARELEIAEATVKVHVKSILRVMGVNNRTQAALQGRSFLGEGK
jgi:two-component system, NarL family, nitrate/nitrite response regulator NarL